MRDPMRWALTVFRAFGIPVRVHLFFFLITIPLCFRQMYLLPHVWWGDIVLLSVVVLFLVVLLHEFGHCFGARSVDGDAKEVLIWPLGGLAYVDVPHTPRANFITTAAGPAVNVVICVACAVGMAVAGYLPNLNPLRDPYRAEVYNFRAGQVETSSYGSGAARVEYLRKTLPAEWMQGVTPERLAELQAQLGHPEAPLAVVWAYRVFWVSWLLFLFNLIPAYPLDGGRLLQCAIWARADYRRGVTVASYSGYVVAVIFMAVSLASNETFFMMLGLFMLIESWRALQLLDADDGPFGYDFSAGYTSLEKDDEPPPRPKKVGWLTRWRQARRARKIQRESEERAAEEARMDAILEKIARSGKDSLTDEEKRFLERVSARKRNMS
ncbi:MAG TPA: site-2 protease family protein [Gemmata sp.]|nr:site-2 protease family protein [Gemmata sp.]